MRLITYDDPFVADDRFSVFLLGPTARGDVRTPWRQRVIDRFANANVSIIIPEFLGPDPAGRSFQQRWDDGKQSIISGMRRSTQRVLDWETSWIDGATITLAWCDMCDETPGKTTRSEVGRATALHEAGVSRGLLIYGIPPWADTTGHIRYHAHLAGIRVYDSLDACCDRVIKLFPSMMVGS